MFFRHNKISCYPTIQNKWKKLSLHIGIYIHSVNKYMLQGSVVDRWVQSDHIFLIHPSSKTLPFGTKGHQSFREDA
jgi:hypothetical protein